MGGRFFVKVGRKRWRSRSDLWSGARAGNPRAGSGLEEEGVGLKREWLRCDPEGPWANACAERLLATTEAHVAKVLIAEPVLVGTLRLAGKDVAVVFVAYSSSRNPVVELKLASIPDSVL